MAHFWTINSTCGFYENEIQVPFPESNRAPEQPEHWWLEDSISSEDGLFSRAMLVSGRVLHLQPPPRRMPLASHHQKTKRLLGAARGSTTRPFWTAQQTADSFQTFKSNGILVTVVHLFKGNMWETMCFLKFRFLSIFLKELFNLTISALKLLCCSYPRTKQHTHTQRSFQGKLGIPTFNTQDRDIINIIHPPIPWSWNWSEGGQEDGGMEWCCWSL